MEKNNSEQYKVHADSTQIKGHIENHQSSDSISEINFYINDLASGYLDYKSEIDSLGNFKIKFPLKRQQDITIGYKNWLRLVVQSGESIELTLNAKDTTSQMAYNSAIIKGGDEKTNQQLFKYLANDPFDSAQYYDLMQTASTSKFIKYQDSVHTKIDDYINNFIENNEVTEAINDWIFVDQNFSPVERVLGYPLNLRMYQKHAEVDSLPNSFFDVLKDLPKLKEKHFINSALYGSFSNYYSYHISDKIRMNNQELGKKVLDSLVIHTIVTKNKNNPILAQIAVNEKLKSSFENNEVAYYEENKNVLSVLFKGSIFDSIHKNKIAGIKKLLANPVLPEKAELLTFVTEDTSKYLDEIIKNANGKVVYIDNWATWCGPCKREFKNSTPALKEKFGDVIEFIYLCYQSKEELWKPTISQFKVEGKHYFVERGNDKGLFEQLNLEGFPTYVIVNKKGDIVKTGFEYRPSLPGTTEILTELVAE